MLKKGLATTIAFRVDASLSIGSGHVMRCLTLADQLQDKVFCTILFICCDYPGHMKEQIQHRGYAVVLLKSTLAGQLKSDVITEKPWEQDACQSMSALQKKLDLLVVDHYGLDERWHKQLRNMSNRIMVIDDIADKKYDCDILLNQTYGIKENLYHSLVPEKCNLLLGAKYALLRPEFASLRPKALTKRRTGKSVKRVLICLGGMDIENVAGKVLESLAQVKKIQELQVDVVLNGNAPHIFTLKEQSSNYSFKVNILVDVNNMAKLMLESDIAIGAAGSTAWERCCLGLPSLMIVVAENQIQIAKKLSQVNAAVDLGWHNKITNKKLLATLNTCLFDDNLLRVMSDSAEKTCDGMGVFRTVQILVG